MNAEQTSRDYTKISPDTGTGPTASERLLNCKRLLEGNHSHLIYIESDYSQHLNVSKVQDSYVLTLFELKKLKFSKFKLCSKGQIISSSDLFYDKNNTLTDEIQPSATNLDQLLKTAIGVAKPAAQASEIIPIEISKNIKSVGPVDLTTAKRLKYELALRLWSKLYSLNKYIRLTGFKLPLPAFAESNLKSLLADHGIACMQFSKKNNDNQGVTRERYFTTFPSMSNRPIDRVARKLREKLNVALLFSPSELVNEHLGGMFVGSTDITFQRGIVLGLSDILSLLRYGDGVSHTMYHEIWHAHTNHKINNEGRVPLFSGYQLGFSSSRITYAGCMSFDEIPAHSLSLHLSAIALKKAKRMSLSCFLYIRSRLHTLSRCSGIGWYMSSKSLSCLKKAQQNLKKLPGCDLSDIVSFFDTSKFCDKQKSMLVFIKINPKKRVALESGPGGHKKLMRLLEADISEKEKNQILSSLVSDAIIQSTNLKNACRSVFLKSASAAIAFNTYIISFFAVSNLAAGHSLLLIYAGMIIGPSLPPIRRTIAKYLSEVHRTVRKLNKDLQLFDNASP